MILAAFVPFLIAGPFESALSKLNDAPAITATYVDRTVGGAKLQWTIKLQRPNKMYADCETTTIAANGKEITTKDKVADRAYRVAEDADSLARVIGKPGLFLARLFFEKDAKWVSSGEAADSRVRDGVALNGTRLKLDGDTVAIIYVAPSTGALALIQFERPGTESHLLDKFQVQVGEIPDSAFEFLPATSGTAAPNRTPESLREEAEGLIPYRPLAWADFAQVDVPPEQAMQAHTQAFIRYSYRCSSKPVSGGWDAALTSLDVRSGIDRARCWRMRTLSGDPDKLLRHEQGHLDINEIAAKKLRKPLGQWMHGFGATSAAAIQDLQIQIKRAFDEAINAARDEQTEYDTATNHGRIESAQLEWVARIKRELEAGH